jgi:TonB family protein
VLFVAISATGEVDAVRLVQPLEPGLDANAIDAVSRCTFTPATKDGKPVAVQFEVTIGFDMY